MELAVSGCFAVTHIVTIGDIDGRGQDVCQNICLALSTVYRKLENKLALWHGECMYKDITAK